MFPDKIIYKSQVLDLAGGSGNGEKIHFHLFERQNNPDQIQNVIQVSMKYSELITLGVITFGVALNAKCNNA